MFEHVLVPVDGSDSATGAVEHAVALAGRFEATVHALYVRDDGELPGELGDVPDDSDLVAELDAAADAALAAVADRCESASVPVRTVVRTGRPTDEILDYAAEAGVDLIVLGTHPRGPVERFLRESVAEQVSQATSPPVLTVGEAPAEGYGTVLLATDGRSGSGGAEDCAFALAGTFGATLHGVYVVDSRFGRSGPLQDVLEREGESVARALDSRGVQEGVTVVTATRNGRPATEILDYAAGNDVDLIVVGTQGRRGLDRFVLGSVASRLLREAPAPVLTVRAGADG